uniref:Uncharacterized protein n=1 Tax=Leersia perrieri TaxID=77586 RepID=A0A0D9X0G6_9ORYZ
MGENAQGSGRHPFGDLTNVLGKRPTPLDLEKSTGGMKIARVEKAAEPIKEFDEAANASGGAAQNMLSPFDGIAREFRKIQHMAAEAAGLLSKESDGVRNCATPLGSSGFHDKGQYSSLESEGGCEEEDDMDSEFLAYTRESSKMATNDAAFMWTDLNYQDSKGRLAALKKSIKFARSLGVRSQGNEYVGNAGRCNLKRAAEMEFELYQQQRSLFLHTENILIRESAQLHSSLVKLKELRENCKTDLEMVTGSSGAK